MPEAGLKAVELVPGYLTRAARSHALNTMRRVQMPQRALSVYASTQDRSTAPPPVFNPFAGLFGIRPLSTETSLTPRQQEVTQLSRQLAREMETYKEHHACSKPVVEGDVAPFSDYSMKEMLDALPSARRLANLLATGVGQFTAMFSPKVSQDGVVHVKEEVTTRDETQDAGTVKDPKARQEAIKVGASLANQFVPPLIMEPRTQFPSINPKNPFQVGMGTDDATFAAYLDRLDGSVYAGMLQKTGVPILGIFGGRDPEDSMETMVDGVGKKAEMLWERGIETSLRTVGHAGPVYSLSNARMDLHTANELSVKALERFGEHREKMKLYDVRQGPTVRDFLYVSCTHGERETDGSFSADSVPVCLDNTVDLMQRANGRLPGIEFGPSDTYGLGMPSSVEGLSQRLGATFGDDFPSVVQHWHIGAADTFESEMGRISAMTDIAVRNGLTSFQVAATLRGGSPFKVKGEAIGIDANQPSVQLHLQMCRTEGVTGPPIKYGDQLEGPQSIVRDYYGDVSRQDAEKREALAASLAASFFSTPYGVEKMAELMVGLDQGVVPQKQISDGRPLDVLV